ncbi:MAG: zinc metallopeptidase [Coriobacteriales bacterium]|jgi:Zn-dependent membrane protease YugP|nr:zinc metallopeptidase [Coriobacteriales bacterium]
MNLSYLLVIVVTMALGFGTNAYIKSTYNKWSKVPITSGLTGAQAARKMLDENGLTHVALTQIPGQLTDHYDPRTQVVSLSQAVYSSRSVAATAIACHECGHAVQHARNYVPANIRSAIAPVVNIASQVWLFALLAGIFLNLIGLIWAAIALYAAVIVFQLVTLPVELDASARAIANIRGYGFLPQQEANGARTVLTAAALTYVAGALSSALQLIYLILMARR